MALRMALNIKILSTMNSIKKFVLKSRLRFILLGILVQIPLAFALSFTSLLIKGFYLWQIIGTAIGMSVLYDLMRRWGKLPVQS